MPPSLPLVSVVIPTKNSARTLPFCLSSIARQTYPNIEVIVVDNWSSDETVKIADKYRARVLLKGPERSAQINFGVQNSNGTYLYRIDSDMIASPNVIQEAVDKCERLSIDGIAIRLLSDPAISFWSKVRSYERMNLYNNDTNVAIRFLSRMSYDVIGGFDERLNGFEDYDLHDRFVRAGFKFGRIESSEIHIGEPKTLSEVIRKHYYYGRDLRRYLLKRRNDHSQPIRRLSFVRVGYKEVLPKLAQRPDLFVGFVTYQIVRYMATALGAALEP